MAIDLDALAKGHQVRRGEQADAQAGGPIDALQHGASGTFAVGAGDVDKPEPVLRIARQRSQLERVSQAELRAEPAQAVKELDGDGVGHLLHDAGLAVLSGAPYLGLLAVSNAALCHKVILLEREFDGTLGRGIQGGAVCFWREGCQHFFVPPHRLLKGHAPLVRGHAAPIRQRKLPCSSMAC